MLINYNDNVDKIPQGIKKLKKEKEIYLYGNSSYAEKMKEILCEFSISIKGTLVSKEYYLVEPMIYEAETFLKNLDKQIAIVAGFNISYHKKLLNKLIGEKNIKTIYVLNGCNLLWENNFEFFDPKIFLIDNYYTGLIKRNLNYNYFHDNLQKFTETYEWLEDEKSKITMEAYLKGHIELSNFPMRDIWKTSDVKEQYFPSDIIKLTENEVFIDCGAYTGDTLEIFLKKVSSFKKYYALEPDVRRFEELNSKLKEGIIHIPIGVWNKKERLYFSTKNECGEINLDEEDNQIFIDVDKIDNIVDKDEKVTFIKMDIEGSELLALYGAYEVIKRDKPTLAICVYHKREDLIAIPQYIKSIIPEYKLYLRGHFPYASELVLYAVYQQSELKEEY